MTESFWLYPLMIPFISDETTLLGSAIRIVCKFMDINFCAIRPMERTGSGDKVLIYRDGECSIVSYKEFESTDLNLIKMTCKKAFEFADFYSKAEEATLGDEASRVFLNFCELFYDEFMGQFIKSGADVAMEVKEVSKNFNAYPGSKNTIENINFKIHRGQLTIIMGPSGCGKSTALNIMGGLLKPTSGSVYLCGNDGNVDICKFNKKQMTRYRRDSIGFIFQSYNLISDLTVKENVEISESLATKPSDTRLALEAVDMQDKSEKYPFRLSGGEQQRVCIARALVKNAEVLLCDEPTGALDTVNSKNIITILQRQAKAHNVAVVVVTHNPDYEAIADHYIEMKNGRVIIDDYRPFPFDAEKIL